MPTRRHMIGGVILAVAGGGALSGGAFTTDASGDADMRVVVVSELQLEPARDDEAYVSRTDGDIQITFDTTAEAGGLNQNAYSRFDQLVAVVNNGTVGYDELIFSFAVPESTAESLSPESGSALVDAMEIVSTHDVTATDGEFIIEQELTPGDEVVFGIGVDLLPGSDTDLPDLEDGIDLELTITATQDT